MDGRKFDWICKELGLFKVELVRQLRISHQSLVHLGYTGATCCPGNPRVLATGPHGGLLGELGEPEKEKARKAVREIAARQKLNFCCKCKSARNHKGPPCWNERIAMMSTL